MKSLACGYAHEDCGGERGERRVRGQGRGEEGTSLRRAARGESVVKYRILFAVLGGAGGRKGERPWWGGDFKLVFMHGF